METDGLRVPPRPARSGRPATQFAQLRRDTVPVQVIGAIKDMILAGKLVPGQSLPPERDLAVQLGVSRPSLREAVRALSAMNILESRQGDGSYVTSLDAALLAGPIDFVLRVDDSAIISLFEVRQVLETYSAAVAADKMTDEEIAELEALVHNEEGITDQSKLAESDLAFHAAIIRGTHNPILVSIALTISQLSFESRRRTAFLPSLHGAAAPHHRRILAALRSRDPDAAREAMGFHIDGVAAAYRAHLQQDDTGDVSPPASAKGQRRRAGRPSSA